MKKLVMLVTLGLVAPMFGARPILPYGDRNLMGEKMLFTQEEQEMLPERRTGLVDEKGQLLLPALPPRPTTKHATKELNAQDLQNLKLRPASAAGTKETLMVEQ